MINEYLNKVITSICKIDVNQLIADLSTRNQEIISLNEQLMRLRNVNNSNATQIVQLESEIDNQKNKINTLQSLNVELSSILESNRTDITSLQNVRNNLSSEIANKLQTINEQNLRNTALQEELNQTKSALQNSNQEYTRLQEYTIQMRNKCSELEQNIQSISDENNALSINVAELQNQIAENNKEIERLKEKDSQTTASNEELLRKQTHLQEEVLAIRTEKDTLLQQLESALQNSNQEYTRLQEYTIQMRNKCSVLERNIQNISDEKDALSSNVTELHNQVAENNKEIERLKENNNRSTATNEELLRKQTYLYEDISTINAEKNALLQKLEEERIRSKQQLEEHRQTIESLSSEKAVFITQVGTLQNCIADYEIKVNRLEEENNQLSVTNEVLLSKHTLLQEEVSIINEEKSLSLQQVDEETQTSGQKIEEPCQPIGQASAEEDALETKPIYQDYSEIKNDIIEEKQEETITDVNVSDDEEIVPDNILSDLDLQKDIVISTDIMSDSNDVKVENLDCHEHIVMDELSVLVSSEVIDGDIDDASVNSIGNEQGEVSSDETKINIIEANDDEQEDDSLPYFYDDSLVPADKLSIPEVYDVKEEKTINSRDFFSQNENELILWRRNLQEEYLMGHARFICPECKQPVKISGHKLARGRVCYFAHFKDSDDCQYKTGTHRTKEEIERLKYSLVQESDRHKRLKAAIASALKGERSISMGVENVECEKRIKSDIPYLNWRRPDIYAEYKGRKYVFELQLSTTFVSVVVDRDIFYRLNDYNIIWVFNFEDNAEYVNLHNLMCKDIYYANKRNVFIFDADTEERSKEKGELVLKCRWLDENGIWSSDQYVTLDMLQYDEENCKPFIVDADKAYLEKYPEYVERRKQLEHSREYLLKRLMERQKHEEELEKKKMEERSNLQLEILNDDKSVTRFRSGTKYGYQYEGTIILPAKYTSAEDFHNNKYAQVGFNRKVGLVRKDGKEVVPVEYKTVKVVDEEFGILLGLYKKIHLWFGDEIFDLVYEYNDKEQDIITEQDDDKIEYILRSKKYSYYHTGRYYEGYPIRRKSHDGYDCSTLFTFLKGKDFCTLWIGNKVYMMAKNGDFVKGQYSDIKPIGIEHIFIVKNYNTELWGVIDIQGNVITDFKYSLLLPTNSEYLITKYESTSILLGLIDYQGREYFAPKFEALFCLSSDFFAFNKNGLWGICDRFGKIIHKAEYTYIRSEMSGSLRASTLNFYKNKWEYVNGIYYPHYFDENEKLCLLDDKGEISYTEQIKGNYIVRRSGDLYSIYSLSNDQLVDYCLLSVSFVTDTLAIIESVEGKCCFYYDYQSHYIDNCIRINYLCRDIFTFENKFNQLAIGNHLGPISEYLYNSISLVDSSHFKASKRNRWPYNAPNTYCIINESGNVLSNEFSYIGSFQNNIAEAIYDGRHGIINSQGEMQENIVEAYGDYKVYEKFEHLYFKNSADKIISEECQTIEPLCQSFFSIKSCSNNYVRIFSLEECLPSDKYFASIELLEDKLFVVKDLLEYKNPYRLYKGISLFIDESFSSVKLLENGYIAFQKRIDSSYTVKYIWKIVKPDGVCLTNREFDSITTVTSDSFEVVVDGKSGKIDLNGYDVIEKSEFNEDLILTKCFGNYGLEDKKGNIVLSLDHKFTNIVFLNSSCMKVCKDSKYALFNISGKRLTKYKYSDIFSHEDGIIYAMRNNHTGLLNEKGKEIPKLEAFNGGYICSTFGEYSVVDETKMEVIIPKTNSKIELLDEDGVFTLQNNGKISLANKSKNVTTITYDSVKNIGHGFFIVSRCPYSFYVTKIHEYGIIDKNLKTIIPCKYKSISGFDSNDKLEAKKKNGKNVIFSLAVLNRKSTGIMDLTAEVEYQARVKGFLSIGIIVEINDSTYIIHEKYLYKPKSEFAEGEILVAKYLSNDKDGHPVWETSCYVQESAEELTENKN